MALFFPYLTKKQQDEFKFDISHYFDDTVKESYNKRELRQNATHMGNVLLKKEHGATIKTRNALQIAQDERDTR